MNIATVLAAAAVPVLMFSGCAVAEPSPRPLPAIAAVAAAPARINYPRIFGVRPASPFLFRVPVSGTRPFKVTALGLPAGLNLDPASGIVTGVITSLIKQSYLVTFTAANVAGSSTQVIRFVVGDRICLTPPMGWNSWYVWSESVSEAHFRGAAEAFERNGLPGHGWSYINLDDCWQGERAGADQGRALQANAKFPDMRGAVEQIHAYGLKAGIYTVPMIGSYAGFRGSSCANAEGVYEGLDPEKRLQPEQIFGRHPGFRKFGANTVGAHWFFAADMAQIASWGFDFIKVDWHPNDVPTTERISQGVRAQKRDIVLSLSNSASFEHAADYANLAELWRTTGDIHDAWESIAKIGFAQKNWAPFAGPGHWNDADMLQIGRTNTANQLNANSRPTRLTREEQLTQFSLWCLNASPLIISCDLTRLDGFTLAMLSNDEVIAVDQDPLGKPATELPAIGALRLFVKEMEDGSRVIGIVNTGTERCDTVVPWATIGQATPCELRDLWAHQTLAPAAGGLEATLPPHGCLLLRTQTRQTLP